MSRIKNCLAILSLLYIIYITPSCEKDDTKYLSLSKSLNVALEKSGNSIKVKWTLTRIDQFSQYRVCRSTDKNAYNYYYYSSNSVVYSTTDYFEHEYTDYSPRFIGTNYYWVEALSTNSYGNSIIIRSNLDSVNLGDFKSFNLYPINPIFSKEENLLGFANSSGKFTVFNYAENKVVGTVDIQDYRMTPAFGYYNNELELYVPYGNGLVIYDALTLTLKSSVSIASGNYIYNVCSNNTGKLYAKARYDYYLYIINRSTLTYTSIYTGDYYDMNLQYLNNTRTLVGKENDSYSDICFWDVDMNGALSNKRSSYCSGYTYAQFSANPNNKEVYVLPQTYLFDRANNSNTLTNNFFQIQDIAFGDTLSYAVGFASKFVSEYYNGALQRSFSVSGYPIHIFIDGSQMIVFFVEKAVSYSTALSYTNYKGYTYSEPFGIQIINIAK